MPNENMTSHSKHNTTKASYLMIFIHSMLGHEGYNYFQYIKLFMNEHICRLLLGRDNLLKVRQKRYSNLHCEHHYVLSRGSL